LASLAALLQVAEADLAYLGRWSPTSAKGYVRTATEVVMKVQGAVARKVRQDFGMPVETLVGEQAAYLAMRQELLRRNFGEKMIDDQLESLRAWTEQLAVPLGNGPAASDLWESVPVVLGVEAPDEEEVDAREQALEAEGPGAPPTPPLVSSEEVPAPPPLPVADGPGVPPETGYVVSISKSDWRRLHRLGGCSRHPGVHYLQFELLGDERPKPEEYDDFCRQCWRTGGPDEGTDDEDSETDQEEEDAPLLVDELDQPRASGPAGSAEGFSLLSEV